MNFAGAMRGLGEGMQSFSGTMREKQKMDWTAQQNQLKHERDMNLQKLRDANANKRQDGLLANQQTMQTERLESAEGINSANIASREGTNAANIASREQATKDRQANAEANTRLADELAQGRKVVGMDANGVQVLAGEYENMTDEQKQAVVSPQAWKAEEALRQQEAQVRSALKLSQEERTRKADDLRQMYGPDMTATEAMRADALEKGLSLKDIVSVPKPMSAEMLENIDKVLATDETYVNGDLNMKTQMIKDTYNRIIGGGGGGAGGKMTAEMIAKAQANPEKITEEDVAKASGSDKALLQSLMNGTVSPETRKPVPVADPGKVQGNVMTGSPTGPEREGPNLGSMLYNKVQGAFQGLRQ